MQDREKYQLRFVEEIKKSIEAYQSEDIEKSPHVLILTGVVEELKELSEFLNGNLHIPSKILSYFKNLAVSPKVAKGSGDVGQNSFLGVIAPLFFLDELKADLVPEEVKLSKTVEERGRELIKTGILILTSFVLIFLVLLSKIYFKTTYLERIDAKYQKLNEEAQFLEGDFSKISLIKNYISKRGSSLEVISTLYDVAPINLKIIDIKFDTQGTFSIKGTAESMATVFSFVDKMEKAVYFRDVKTRYTTKRKDGLKDVTDFEIIAELEKNEEGE
jgi:hypothetical protein